MVRSVETLRKELSELETATTDLATEFDQLYDSYLQSLDQATRRQVVLAVYQLCTQIYPEAFLDLTIAQREKLQQAVQSLGIQAGQWLRDLIQPSLAETEPAPEFNRLVPSDPEQTMVRQPGDDESDQAEPEPGIGPDFESDAPAEDALPVPTDHPDPDELIAIREAVDALAAQSDLVAESDSRSESDRASFETVLIAAIAHRARLIELQEEEEEGILTPKALAKRHLLLEQQIRGILKRVSHRTNQLLRQVEVLPNLPEAVLEAATEAETTSDKLRSAPNLLNMLVELSADGTAAFEDQDEDEDEGRDDDDDRDDEDMESEEDTGPTIMTHLAAVNLRLSDIEFTDMQTSIWRGKLRAAVGKLRKLGKQYQKTQRELAIAQAEQAWRSVWYDNSAN